MAARPAPLQSASRSDLDLDGHIPLQSPLSPGLSRSSNPLVSKVSAVLSTSFVDSDFRQSLALLDERGTRNDAETRRQLRLRLQKEVIDCNSSIINDFGLVADQLRRIGTTLEKLDREFEASRTSVLAAHAKAAPALDEAGSLLSRKSEIEVKQQILVSFQGRFLLTDEENATLVLASEPVDERFFVLLAKARRIVKECEILLGFEKQSLGMELMEQTSKALDLAYQKLYKWIQREFKTLNLENPRMSSSVRRALRVLAERPSLFENCLSFFAEARERVLSDSFYLALTGASQSGVEDASVKPIDILAHDALRYVGDMLAWTHSAAVGEREALEVLFVSEGNEIARGLRSGKETELWHLGADGDVVPEFDAAEALDSLVDRDIAGVGRLLRQRVEQAIRTNENIISAYKLSNLLSFYQTTFSKLLGPKSALVASVSSSEGEAMRQFRSLIRDHVATLQSEFQPVPDDLRPPPFFADSLDRLSAILKTFESSFSAASDQEAGYAPILAEAFDPFISRCESMAQALDGLESSIFLLNCRLSALSALQKHDVLEPRVRELLRGLDTDKEKLASEQYRFFRAGSGLDRQLHDIQGVKDADMHGAAVRQLESFHPRSLTQASQSLDDFLPSALMDAMENIRSLEDPVLAREITEEAARRFCNDFAAVEDGIIAADALGLAGGEGLHGQSKSQILRDVFPRTAGEIRVLLS